MEEETSKTGGDDGVADQEVPTDPLPLDPVKRGEVGGSVELLCGILVEYRGGCGSRVKGHDRAGKGDGTENSGSGSPSCIPHFQKSDHFIILPTTATPLDMLPSDNDHCGPECK